jgi:hypothetical protein
LETDPVIGTSVTLDSLSKEKTILLLAYQLAIMPV